MLSYQVIVDVFIYIECLAYMYYSLAYITLLVTVISNLCTWMMI